MVQKKEERLNLRVTPECKRLLEALADGMGISITAAVEVAARDTAKARGIQLPAEAPGAGYSSLSR